MNGFKGSSNIFRILSLYISFSFLSSVCWLLSWTISFLVAEKIPMEAQGLLIFQLWFQRRRETLFVPAFMYLILRKILAGPVEVTCTSLSQSSWPREWNSLSSQTHQFTPIFEGLEGGGRGRFLLGSCGICGMCFLKGNTGINYWQKQKKGMIG